MIQNQYDSAICLGCGCFPKSDTPSRHLNGFSPAPKTTCKPSRLATPVHRSDCWCHRWSARGVSVASAHGNGCNTDNAGPNPIPYTVNIAGVDFALSFPGPTSIPGVI